MRVVDVVSRHLERNELAAWQAIGWNRGKINFIMDEVSRTIAGLDNFSELSHMGCMQPRRT